MGLICLGFVRPRRRNSKRIPLCRLHLLLKRQERWIPHKGKWGSSCIPITRRGAMKLASPKEILLEKVGSMFPFWLRGKIPMPCFGFFLVSLRFKIVMPLWLGLRKGYRLVRK